MYKAGFLDSLKKNNNELFSHLTSTNKTQTNTYKQWKNIHSALKQTNKKQTQKYKYAYKTQKKTHKQTQSNIQKLHEGLKHTQKCIQTYN